MFWDIFSQQMQLTTSKEWFAMQHQNNILIKYLFNVHFKLLALTFTAKNI